MLVCGCRSSTQRLTFPTRAAPSATVLTAPVTTVCRNSKGDTAQVDSHTSGLLLWLQPNEARVQLEAVMPDTFTLQSAHAVLSSHQNHF
jgi:hypothetical protein